MKTKLWTEYPLRVNATAEGVAKPTVHAAQAILMNGRPARRTACGRMLVVFTESDASCATTCLQCRARLR